MQPRYVGYVNASTGNPLDASSPPLLHPYSHTQGLLPEEMPNKSRSDCTRKSQPTFKTGEGFLGDTNVGVFQGHCQRKNADLEVHVQQDT